MSPPYKFTRFRGAKQPGNGVRLEMCADELADSVASAGEFNGDKLDLPLICPATFADNYRKLDGVETLSMLPIDVDVRVEDPAALAAAISRALGGVELVWHTTFSSQPAAYKTHAFLPYDEPAIAADHTASWFAVAGILRRAGILADPQCKDASRGMFTWAIPPNGVYAHGHILGAPWPVARAAALERRHAASLAESRAAKAARAPVRVPRIGGRHASAFDRARAWVAKADPAIEGSDGSGKLWRVARAVVQDFRLNDSDAMTIMREYSLRCDPPWSEYELLHKLNDAKKARVSVDKDSR